MKVERIVIYRLYLFGMLPVLLNMIIQTVLALLYPGENSAIKDRESELIAETGLLAVIVVLMLLNKRATVQVGKFRFEVFGRIALIATFFLFLDIFILTPFIWLFCLAAFLGFLLFGLVIRNGVYFLFGITQNKTIQYHLAPKSMFIVAALALVLLSVSHYIIRLLLDLCFPFKNEPLYMADANAYYFISKALVWALIFTIILYHKKKVKGKPVFNKGTLVKLLVSLTLIYASLIQLQLLFYLFLMNNNGTLVLRILLFFISAIIAAAILFKAVLIRDDEEISEYKLIRVSLIFFSVIFIIGSLSWQFVMYKSLLYNPFLIVIAGILPVVFSKPLALLITGERAPWRPFTKS